MAGNQGNEAFENTYWPPPGWGTTDQGGGARQAQPQQRQSAPNTTPAQRPDGPYQYPPLGQAESAAATPPAEPSVAARAVTAAVVLGLFSGALYWLSRKAPEAAADAYADRPSRFNPGDEGDGEGEDDGADEAEDDVEEDDVEEDDVEEDDEDEDVEVDADEE